MKKFLVVAIITVGVIIIKYFLFRDYKKKIQLFSEKKYLVVGEQEIKKLEYVPVTWCFLRRYRIYTQANIIITNKRVVIYEDRGWFYYTPPVSLFYTKDDMKKYGNLFTRYLILDCKKELDKTILKTLDFATASVWRIENTEVFDLTKAFQNKV